MSLISIQLKKNKVSQTSPVVEVSNGEVGVSLKAAERILQLAAQEGKTNFHFRLGVQGGGCSGLSYRMEFVEEVKANDKVWQAHGISFCMDPKSFRLLEGSLLDLHEEIGRKTLLFRHKNKVKSCSCGESFSV